MLKVLKAGCVTKREDAKPEVLALKVLANQRSLYRILSHPLDEEGMSKPFGRNNTIVGQSQASRRVLS